MVPVPHPHGARGARRAAATSLAVLTTVAVALGTAGCGDERQTASSRSDEAGRATTTSVVAYSDWQQALELDCAAVNSAHAEVAAADPHDAEEAEAYAEQVDRFVRELDDAISAAGRPAQHAEAAARLSAAVGQLAAASTALRAAAEERDADAAARAADQIAARGLVVNELSVQLRVPACGGF